jgi:hypothetical protein
VLNAEAWEARERNSRTNGFAIGGLVIVFYLIASGWIGDAFTDLILRVGGEFTNGVVVWVSDHIEDAPRPGETVEVHTIFYKFTAQNGQQYSDNANVGKYRYTDPKYTGAEWTVQHSRVSAVEGADDAGATVIVEYLPRNPSIHRLRFARTPESLVSVLIGVIVPSAALVVCLWPSGLVLVRIARRRLARKA